MRNYEIHIHGLATKSGSISVAALLTFVQELRQAAQRGLRLVLEGESVRSGPAPDWLAAATDFVLTGVRRGSTRLDVEAPELGKTTDDLLKQEDLWRSLPAPTDTALTVLQKACMTTAAQDDTSEFIDAGVLQSVVGFGRFIGTHAESVSIRSSSGGESIAIDAGLIEKATALSHRTPEPRQLAVSGCLDIIHHAAGQFVL